jgi:hypothetical protein
MGEAFELAWRSLQQAGSRDATQYRAQRTREILARLIIDQARHGERDVARLRDRALSGFDHGDEPPR